MPYYCNALSKKSPYKVLVQCTLFTLNFNSKKDNFLSLTMELKLFFGKYFDILDNGRKGLSPVQYRTKSFA